MATLETQYLNYLKENQNSTYTFEEWKNWFSDKLKNATINVDEDLHDWDVTLNDGLEDEPYISDNFQIGPDGAFEHEETFPFEEFLNYLSKHLTEVKYKNGDVADLGNEIGIAIGYFFKDISDDDIKSFIAGVYHGIDFAKH
jgi:hypothetical protein